MSRPASLRFALVPVEYRGALFGGLDARSRRCLSGAAALGVTVLLIVHLTPLRPRVLPTVQQLPPRVARLILAPPPAPAPATSRTQVPRAVERAAPPQAPVAPEPKPVGARRRASAESIGGVQGQAGRARAERELSSMLGGAGLEQTLAGLSSSLGRKRAPTASPTSIPTSAVRAARAAPRTSSRSSTGGSLAGSLLAVSSLEVLSSERPGRSSAGSTTPSAAPGGRRARTAGESSAAPSPGRSDASLLAVVRRYAPGIEFCYDEQLKGAPALRGKLAIEVKVAPSGEVLTARIVEDTLRSDALRECVLAQVREWRFPAADAGDVTFRAPFVFTPPAQAG